MALTASAGRAAAGAASAVVAASVPSAVAASDVEAQPAVEPFDTDTLPGDQQQFLAVPCTD